MPAFSVSAMPTAPAHSVIAGIDSSVILAKGGHGHGWGRAFGRPFGWSRGRKVGWRGRGCPRVFGSKGAAEQGKRSIHRLVQGGLQVEISHRAEDRLEEYIPVMEREWGAGTVRGGEKHMECGGWSLSHCGKS